MRLIILSNIFSLLLGGFLTYKFFPRTEIVQREVEVIKEIEVRDVVTKIVRVLPDGTKEDIVIVDKTKIEKDTSKDRTILEVRQAEKDWHLSVIFTPININRGWVREYEATLERRIIGPWRVGLHGSSAGSVGLSLGISW